MDKTMTTVSIDRATAFRKWLDAGFEFCERSEIEGLVASVMARERAFIAAVETKAEPTLAVPTVAVDHGIQRRTAIKHKGGAKQTTSAFVTEVLKERPDVTSHDIAALVRMRHSKVRVPNVYAAIFRLVTNGTIKKTGERGSFHYALN